MRQTILLIFGLMIFSCNQEGKEMRPEGANMKCENFFVKGQYNYDTYTFCGIVPVEAQYRYKSGDWKFWNLEGQLIAEGAYKLEKKTIEDMGGCPYEIIEGVIDESNWKFWDKKGNQIGFNDDLRKQLKSCVESLNYQNND